MIVDSYDLPAGQSLFGDVCIVGAGAAGITMALDLVKSGMSVLVLESGGLTPDAATQALYAGSVADERLHSPPDRYRQRRFGGTTTIWGGRCMPFDDIDFTRRDYIADSGWPLTRAELEPYYVDANRLCEAGRYAYTSEEAFSTPLRPMIAGFYSENFTSNSLERFSCPTDFGRRYGGKLAAASQIRVVLHANVTEIRLNEAGTAVIGLVLKNLRGQRFEVMAKHVVLATGGLEVPRLLLANRETQRNGIGNDHDVVGRYYMCHLAGTIGRIRIDGPLTNAWHGYDVSDEGIYCRRRLALRPAVQRAAGLGNFVARLHHPRITEPEHRNAILSLLYLAKFVIPYEYGKRLHGDEAATLRIYTQHLRNVLSGPLDAAEFAMHMLRDRKLADRKFPSIIIRSKANLFSLDFHAEQEPNAMSRVTLETRLDALGLPQLRVDWRYTPGDVRTVSRALALLAADFSHSKVATFDYDPGAVEAEMTRYGAYGGHHIGTARMGTDPRQSVVDRDCRVHGLENLYVAGSATFPTSSQANPTLTIVALALRLANHLRGQLRS